MLSPIFERFVEKSPVSVMVRGLLERVVGADKLDAFFYRVARKQYTRTLLFWWCPSVSVINLQPMSS